MDPGQIKEFLAEVKGKVEARDERERLENIDAAISRFRQEQDEDAVAADDELRELTAKIADLRAECSRAALDWIDHPTHVERVHALEREQAEWGKKIEADEARLRAVEAEVRKAKEECAEWEEVVVEDEVEFSGDALALRFFRNLGFVPSYAHDISKLKKTPAAAAVSSKKNNRQSTTAPTSPVSTFDRVLVRSESTGRAVMLDVSAQGRAIKGWNDRDMAAQLWTAAR